MFAMIAGKGAHADRPGGRGVETVLFGVLDLFLDAVDGGFDFDDFAGDGGVAGLRAHGVGFAEHFLGDELEFAAGGFVGVGEDTELLDVACEAAEFFADVAAFGVDRDFLDQVVFGEAYAGAVDEFGDAGVEAVAVFDDDDGGARADCGEGFFDDGDVGLEVGGEGVAFGGAHVDEAFECLFGELTEDLPAALAFGVGQFGGLADAGEGEQGGEVDGDALVVSDGFGEGLDVGGDGGDVEVAGGLGAEVADVEAE